jgi:pilus assembly protein FimV
VVAAQPAGPVAAAASRPSPAAAEAPSAIGSMIDDNPWGLALGAAAIALLAGLGIYKFSRRSRKDSGETSFLESRLQPDSFFGASGGQRIDTRDASGASSSMSYSLSQLDAIGDVDPVAEADVYLAYGRDLQAEEILKEAMRSTPERLAIRTKLLEVYAKRRDTKGFELLATQLFALTRGEGEDWAKAQELGAAIDPDNTLYQPGGAPALAGGIGDRMTEPLSASTMPQSVLPTPSRFEALKAKAAAAEAKPVATAAAAAAVGSGPVDVDLDLDLDLDVTVPAPSASMPLSPAPVQARDSERDTERDSLLRFDPVPELPTIAVPPLPAATTSAGDFPMDFDLSAISLDLEPTVIVAPPAPAAALPDIGEIDFEPEADDGSDPLARKLELAEEFRQIGDMEGARDLLQEVVVKASGALKTKAQGMLDTLA